jgi:phage host-nuclease inhibitor protein Gam
MTTETEELADEALPATVDELAAWVGQTSALEVQTQAGWWLRSLSIAQAELERLQAMEEAEVSRVRRFYARQGRATRDRADALTRSLEALTELVSMPKGKKSLALTYGTIGRKTQPAALRITDDAAAVAFAKAQGLVDAVKVTEKPVHKVLSALLLADAVEGCELPDGIELVPAREVAVVTPNTLGAQEVL